MVAQVKSSKVGKSTLRKPVAQSAQAETPVVIRREPERDLVSWTAPTRPFKRRSREFYVSVISIAAIVGLVLFLVEGWLPVVLIVSLVFLFYVLSTVEPDKVEYKLTNRGIRVGGKRTPWGAMFRFWFSKRFDSELLVIEIANLPGRLEFVINTQVKKELRKNLLKYLPEEEVSPSFLDKATNWFSKKLPDN